jgi:hypothetical protein
MPKLNTTIDNLELKSNRVTGTIPSSSWTDAQYPSAKALFNTYSNLNENLTGVKSRCANLETAYNNLTTTCTSLTNSSNNVINIAHPVGSIMITATSTNPANYIGGTWELVDKGFADRIMYIPSSSWIAAGAAFVSETSSIVELADHTVSLRLNLKNTAALSDTTVDLGTLKLNTVGITELPYTIVSDVTASDGGQCTLSYSIVAGGTITISDVLVLGGAHSLATGNTFSIHINQTVDHARMLDSFCDKFYWKRTA